MSSINTPVLWINKYLQEKIPELSGLPNFPFFPSTPSTINDLTEYFNNTTTGAAAAWDRLVKMRRSAFPHIKNEQVMYYFYAQGSNPIETMVNIQESVLRLLDRGDESAKEINAWARNRQIRLDGNTLLDNRFYFHNFKIYQLEETRDIIDFGTARTYGGNKIIIDYEYHQDTTILDQLSPPEPKSPTKTII